MKKTRRSVEQIIRILREGDRGAAVAQVRRAHKVSAFEGAKALEIGLEKNLSPERRLLFRWPRRIC